MKKLGRCWLLCIFLCSASSENVGTTSFESLFVGVSYKPTETIFTRLAPLAILTQREHGIPASVTLAQCLQESGLGRSNLAKETNNCFGIKCKAKCRKPGHCKNKNDDHDSDRFFIYPSIKESFEHHSRVLSRGRYVRFRFDFRMDWEKWCDGLQDKGYATDKSYARTLKQIIKKHKLYEYDKDAAEQSFGPEMWIAGLNRGDTRLRP